MKLARPSQFTELCQISCCIINHPEFSCIQKSAHKHCSVALSASYAGCIALLVPAELWGRVGVAWQVPLSATAFMLLPAANLPWAFPASVEAQGSDWKPGLRTLLLPHSALQQALVVKCMQRTWVQGGVGIGDSSEVCPRSERHVPTSKSGMTADGKKCWWSVHSVGLKYQQKVTETARNEGLVIHVIGFL